MSRVVQRNKLLSCIASLTVIVGMVIGINSASLAESNTVHVKSVDEMTSALADEDVDHIIIDDSFDVPCKTASNDNGTSYFTINRSMIIEGAEAGVTLKRAIGEGANNGRLQSIFGIRGNGTYDGITVSLFKLTLDGGADFGTRTGTVKMNTNVSTSCLGGRSLVDVYYKATLNLENGATIQNNFCTYSLSSLSGDSGSYNFGGGVRVDFDHTTGGGTVNVKAGSTIKNCVTSGGYGGAIGAYSYARLNVYGGLIEDCVSRYGGAVGCTSRAGHDISLAGTFRMYGGVIRNCSANTGGAICANGGKTCESCLYGGTIDGCTASGQGGALALNGGKDDNPTLDIAPYSEEGPLFITNCTSGSSDTDPDTEYDGKKLGYSGLFLGDPNTPINIENATYSVSFKKYKDDTDVFTKLTVKARQALGESFPADPVDEVNSYSFSEWNTKADGTGKTITKDSEITENIVVYARWACVSALSKCDVVNITYGDSDAAIGVDVDAPYGGDISYQWFVADTAVDGATSDTYNIPVSDIGNYSFTCKVENTLPGSVKANDEVDIKVIIEPKTINIDWSDLSFTADGKAKLPKAVALDIVDGDDVTVEVTGEQTEAGRYIATAKLVGEDSGNYLIAEGNDTAEFVINAAPTATPTVTATPEPTATPTSKPTIAPTAAATPVPSAKVTATPAPTVEVTTAPTGEVTATPSPAADPKSQISAFVERIYIYVLDREPETEGAKFWSDELYAFRRSGAEVAQGFIFSPEFENRKTTDEQFVTILYKTFFGRDPEEGGMKFWLDQLSTGTMDRVAVANGFIYSQEWADTCASYGIRSGGDIKPTGVIAPTELTYAFVERMYTTAMGRSYDEEGRQYWASELANFNITGEQVGASFFLSDEMNGYNLSDKEFLGRLYATFMNREPDADGESYWLGVMSSGAARADIVYGFTRSPEFTDKCIEARILPF